MSEMEYIYNVFAILENEYARLSELQNLAIKKGLGREYNEYECRKEEIKHIVNRINNEIDD